MSSRISAATALLPEFILGSVVLFVAKKLENGDVGGALTIAVGAAACALVFALADAMLAALKRRTEEMLRPSSAVRIDRPQRPSIPPVPPRKRTSRRAADARQTSFLN